MKRKASITSNPLAHPRTPIHRLASRFADYLHLPDPYPLYVLIASLVANYADGRPVWLMLVGPSSCGKSELLNALLSLPQIIEGGSLTGVAALLSATRKKERSPDATGGLLREIGDRGALVIKEFTSILSLPTEPMRAILGAFREIYDGRWTRKVGSDGGSDQHWEGKMAFLTGCTESIDHHHALVSEMGERFVFYRYDASVADGWSESYKALQVKEPHLLSSNLQALLCEFALDLGLDWDHPPVLPLLTSHDQNRLIAFAQFCSHGRSSVIRDHYSKEIIQAPLSEYPIRLSLALSQILRALRFVGVDEADSWRIIRKLALDSIPSTRRLTLLSLMAGHEGIPAIADNCGVSHSTIKRSLEDLSLHQMVERIDTSAWGMTDWARTKLVEGCNGFGLKGIKSGRQ